jgi:hypothetical protein
MDRFLRIIPILVTILIATAMLAFGSDADLALDDPDPPFVICDHQRYALCAEASCFVYNGVAYCKCDVMNGDSISLQLSYTSATVEENVCDVNRQGRPNGYMISTYSLPKDAEKGGTAAAYTCPGSANVGTGVIAPIAYGQCDGGLCFESTRGQRIPGFTGHLRARQIICSCPISTDATAGSSDSLGYQVFGPYHPDAPIGSRCDAREALHSSSRNDCLT